MKITKDNTVVIVLSLLSLLILSSCSKSPFVMGPGVHAPQAEESSSELEFNSATTDETADNNLSVTITNCGVAITYEKAPERAVTMNQAATEIMLALGLQDRMVGTAYIDDEILPEYREAYASIPVLAEQYPSREVLFATEPDFVYGVYASAFADEAAGHRGELLDLGIPSYLSGPACVDQELRPDKATFETVFGEIRNIGSIFGVEERAEALIVGMQTQLDGATAAIGDDMEAVNIFWYDSGEDEPFSGACCGTPGMIIEAVGARNIFTDVEGSWATVSWEEVIARDPEAIVIIEAEWSPAQDKIDLLLNDPVYSSIDAVKNQRFVAIPFSATTLGIRNVNAVVQLAEELYPQAFE